MPFFFGKTWKGTLREIFFFRKISLRDSFGCFSFREKQIRDDFNVTFSLVRKSNQKRRFYVLFASAKRTKKQTEGCGPLDSGVRFKALYRHALYRN